VVDNGSFDAKQFLVLPVKDRVRLCKYLAARACSGKQFVLSFSLVMDFDQNRRKTA
jgi:hypothetical protein